MLPLPNGAKGGRISVATSRRCPAEERSPPGLVPGGALRGDVRCDDS